VYSSVSGSAWALENDGRRKSPAIAHRGITKSRIDFTSAADSASISIQLDVSSESGLDYAFVSTLDNDSATYESGYYTNSKVSGTESVSVTIPVPTAGDHFVEIGYQKNASISSGSDCAWFKVSSADAGSFIIPPAPTRSGYTFDGRYTERNGGGTAFTAASTVSANITVYAKWIVEDSVQVSLQPAWDKLPLSSALLLVNQGGSVLHWQRYNAYVWYWDGAAIEGELRQAIPQCAGIGNLRVGSACCY
jgi:uncharacterized repeat protein (TIGR02543 family)